jgi:hypothetical protein
MASPQQQQVSSKRLQLRVHVFIADFSAISAVSIQQVNTTNERFALYLRDCSTKMRKKMNRVTLLGYARDQHLTECYIRL